MTNKLSFSYGGLKSPSYSESISALYIIFLGYKIKNPFYWMIFMINGLSAFLAHSPYIDNNYSKVRKLSSYIDAVSIYYPLILYIFSINKFFSFFTLLLVDFIFNCKLYKFVLKYNFILILPSIIKIISKGALYKFPFIILITFLSKYMEEKYIIKSLGIKYHTIWHIFGTHMFKNILLM